MILTKYHRTFRSTQEPDSVILYSSKNGALLNVPPQLIDEIRTASLGADEMAVLDKYGYLVRSAEAERNEMLGFIDDVNAMARMLAVKLVMNLDCNLSCIYCFEGQRKGKFFMTPQTADLFVNFVKTWADRLGERKGDEKIVITFYGGEPLLSAELIASISKRIKSFAAAAGLEYIAYMVTNGTLLKPRIVERLRALGLAGAVVTLDGTQKLHDRFRPFSSGRGSFDLIVKNLQDISGMIDVQIGGNYMSDNYREFPALLDYMACNRLTPDRIACVRFSPVAAENSDYGPAEFNQGCRSLNEPWLTDATIYLREEVLKKGYRPPDALLPSVCSLDLKDNMVINYDGSIYKCPCLIGLREYMIGDLISGIRYDRQPQGRDAWKNDECLECIYLPLCFGGCRAMKLVRDGNMDGVDCKKPYLDAILEPLVKQDIKYGLIKL